MGLKRFLWRSTTLGRLIDTTKNVIKEGSLTEGYIRTFKEDVTEDNPITKPFYEMGKYDGKVEGYEKASYEYENKLLKQADEFLEQKKIYKKELDAFNELMDEYEKEIEMLSDKVEKTSDEKELLAELLIRERALKKMA